MSILLLEFQFGIYLQIIEWVVRLLEAFTYVCLFFLVLNRASFIIRVVGTVVSFVFAVAASTIFYHDFIKLADFTSNISWLVLFMPFFVGMYTVFFFPRQHE